MYEDNDFRAKNLTNTTEWPILTLLVAFCTSSWAIIPDSCILIPLNGVIMVCTS
jgi:hypothetical protein